MNIREQAQLAKSKIQSLWKLTPNQRNQILKNLNQILLNNKDQILLANKKDLDAAKEANYSEAYIDRLKLTEERLLQIAQSVLDVSMQEEIVFQLEEEKKRADGLIIKKQRIPLGLVGIIFESRPNVIIDCFSLGIKSANALILKGGKEAVHTNTLFMQLAHQSLNNLVSEDLFILLLSQEEAKEMMSLSGLVDVIIPRGSERLIEYVQANSKVPVICHAKGLCHLYIDNEVDYEKAFQVAINAKCHRTGVCNALETLLIHKNLDPAFKQRLFDEYIKQGIELRLDQKIHKDFPHLKIANEKDWDMEYLDSILSVKEVDSIEEAIKHIQKHGSLHTEAICSKNPEKIEQFLNSVDASCIMLNASTRFNDGGELGLGAEVGISTTKLHAYGPMGAKELTTSRFVVEGDGHIRS